MYNVFFDTAFTSAKKLCSGIWTVRIFSSDLKKVISYQHRDSLEPAQSCPVVFLVSVAPAQAGKVCPEPWLHQSPVNEIWGEILNVFISFSFYTFFFCLCHYNTNTNVNTHFEQQWHQPLWQAWWRTNWLTQHPGNGWCSAESRAGWGTLVATSQTHLKTWARIMMIKTGNLLTSMQFKTIWNGDKNIFLVLLLFSRYLTFFFCILIWF